MKATRFSIMSQASSKKGSVMPNEETEAQKKEEYRKRIIESYVADPADEYGLVDDPVEHDSWIVQLTQWEYTYWIMLGVTMGFFSSVGAYLFYNKDLFDNPILYSTKIIGKLFITEHYWDCIFAQLLIVFILIFYALFTLSQAKKEGCFRSCIRWIIFLIIEIYFLTVFILQCRKLPQMKTDIEHSMRAEFHKYNSILRIKTQSYMHCCGIDEPESWSNTKGFDLCNENDWCGFPISCCNVQDGKPCFRPVPKNIVVDGKIRPRIWQHGCLASEILYADLIAFFILFTIGFIFITSSIMILLMYIISYHAAKNHLELRNEFYAR